MNTSDPVTDFDLSMDDDMILDEIDSQVRCTLPVYNIKKNFLDILYKKYNAMNAQRISEGNDVDPESVEVNNDKLDEYYSAIVSSLQRNLGILFDRGSGEINYQTINSIYNTFVIDLHRNFVEFIVRSIIMNKPMFANLYTGDELKNLTVKMARKTYRNKADSTIAVHIGDIIEHILQDDTLINPENIITVLYQSCPEDYDYNLAINLYKVGYLAFDIPTYMKHLREIYSDAMNVENLKISIMEELLPTFQVKTPEEINQDTDDGNNEIVATAEINSNNEGTTNV